MIDSSCAMAIINDIENLNCGYAAAIKEFKDGNFGDLQEIDFSNGKVMGHNSIWSSGLVFYNLFDDGKGTDYEIIEETHVDASTMSNSELTAHLNKLFNEMQLQRD
jgi:hypothetical protein